MTTPDPTLYVPHSPDCCEVDAPAGQTLDDPGPASVRVPPVRSNRPLVVRLDPLPTDRFALDDDALARMRGQVARLVGPNCDVSNPPVGTATVHDATVDNDGGLILTMAVHMLPDAPAEYLAALHADTRGEFSLHAWGTDGIGRHNVLQPRLLWPGPGEPALPRTAGQIADAAPRWPEPPSRALLQAEVAALAGRVDAEKARQAALVAEPAPMGDRAIALDAREARYADALAAGHTADAATRMDWTAEARAAMAVADAEHAELHARLDAVLALADWFEQQPNWHQWGVHSQIRAAVKARAVTDPEAGR